MLYALSEIDSFLALSIAVKSITYLTSLLAAGSVIALVTLRNLENDARQYVRRIAMISAVAALVFSVMRVPIRSAFLMGGTLEGAVDFALIQMVVDGPLGQSLALRLFGLVLIATLLLPLSWIRSLPVLGAALVCVSFVLRGHALEEPRFVLGSLITIHLLAISFWIGGLLPLLKLTRDSSTIDQAGALTHEFGQKAIGVVVFLAAAGVMSLGVFGVLSLASLESAYVRLFSIKLMLFLSVLVLAALHKLRFTPAIKARNVLALNHLHRSMQLECLLIIFIFVATAVITTVSSPEIA